MKELNREKRIHGNVVLFYVLILWILDFWMINAHGQTSDAPPLKPPGFEQTAENQQINDRYAGEIAERIQGRENDPAGNVFKNLQIEWLKKIPAGRLLGIMNFGYSRGLGVNCMHCHNVENFSSDEKRAKRAAREMAVMHRMINQELAKLKELERKPEERFINCFTCHRGNVDPLAGQR
jgi:hypothetical protein